MGHNRNRNTDLDDRRNELDKELRQLEQRRIEKVQIIDDKPFDVGPIVILKVCQPNERLSTIERRRKTHLIGHDHQPSIPQTRNIRIIFVVLQTHDLFDRLNLLILHNLIMLRLAHIQQLSSQREDTEIVSPDDGESTNGKGFGGISFGENEGTISCVLASGIVGVGEFGHTGESVSKRGASMRSENKGRG